MSLIPVGPDLPTRVERVLCIGAHADDIEIGCGGTMLSLVRANPSLEVELGGAVGRAGACRGGLRRRCPRARARRPVACADRAGPPAVLLIGCRRHQAVLRRPRTARRSPARVPSPSRGRPSGSPDPSPSVWQTFRGQLILEYEIVKYEGDPGKPTTYVELPFDVAEKKVALLNEVFVSQRPRYWFDEETFRGLLRLRGVECRAGSGYAEAFHARKLLLW